MSSLHREAPNRARSSRIRLAAVALSIVSVLSGATAVAARAPLTGAHNTGYYGNYDLKFKFQGSSLPAWLTGAGKGARLVLEDEWLTYNRTYMPRFSYDSAGNGTVVWSNDDKSPCSNINNRKWLACTHGAPDPGDTQNPADPDDPKTYWKIYVRNFAAPGSSYPNWVWSESGKCVAGKTCYDLSRAVLHEAIHLFLGVGSHDNSGEAETIMGENQPSSPDYGWNTNQLQSCDIATGQIYYDLHLKTDPYAKCLTEISGMSSGLPTFVSMAATSFTACYTQPFSVAAQARVDTIPIQDNRLSLNPLEGRTITLYRRPVGGAFAKIGSVTASMTATPAPNVTATLSVGAPGVYEYRLNYVSDGEGINQSLKSGFGPIFKVTWTSTGCHA